MATKDDHFDKLGMADVIAKRPVRGSPIKKSLKTQGSGRITPIL
jgi:hypothetical protein